MTIATTTAALDPPTPDGHWYTALHPALVDVIGDFAGTELSTLDGDALVELVLRDLSRIESPSMLHGVYLVEQVLRKLLDAKSNFEITFFEDRRWIPAARPGFKADQGAAWRLLFRSVVIAHLQRANIVPIYMFDSVNDAQWIAYLDSRKPYYILTEDGSGLETSSEDRTDMELLDAGRSMWMESMWMHLNRGMSVALMSDDMFKDGKLVSFVFHTSRAEPGEAAEHETVLNKSLAILNANAENLQISSFAEIKASDEEGDSMSYVAALLKQMTSTLTPLQTDMAKVFLLHSVTLGSVPLEARSQPLAALPLTKIASDALESFIDLACSEALKTTSQSPGSFITSVDERLFRAILMEILDTLSKGSGDVKAIFADVPGIEKAEATWKTVSGKESVWDLARLVEAREATAVRSAGQSSGSVRPLALLPYSQSFLESYLPKLPADTSMEKDTPFFEAAYIPNYETSHWHVAKPLPVVNKPAKLPSLATRFPPKPQRAAGRARKAEQRQASFIQKYASSLTGASGRVMRPKTIVVQPKKHVASAKARPATPVEDDTAPKGKGKGSGKSTPVLSKKDAIIAANKEKMVAAEKDSANKRWKLLREKIEKMTSIDLAVQELERAMAEDRHTSAKALIEEQKLFKAMFLLNKWATYCVSPSNKEDPATPERKEEGMPVLVQIFSICTGLIASKDATKATVEEARRILKTVALNRTDEEEGEDESKPKASRSDRKKQKEAEKEAEKAAKADSKSKDKKGKSSSKSSKKEEAPVVEEEDAPLSFKFAYPRGVASQSWLRCPHNLTTFQLLHYGTHMDRTMGSAPDPRVDFEPDQWQREVLDTIDRDESVFVVAPTSAGKTFIAFYAIEKVLRESDNGVVVYVAPTKALVNQIAAEISARFSKSYQYAGITTWAVHTRDYRIHEPLKCQVLITVPHILQILMMQPDVAHQWTPRLKRIIFDEIHSISSLEGGLIWEQNLILAPCPIVALSATVGNPGEFADWLKGISAAKGHELKTITHKHRYSDLRKFVYAPHEKAPKFSGLTNKGGSTSLRHLHPIAALSLGSAQIPDDMHLEPFECLQLLDAMQFEKGDLAVLPAKLTPETYFGGLAVIKKSDVIQYQQELKDVLQEWMALPGSRTPSGAFGRVLKRLSSDIDTSLAKMSSIKSSGPQIGIEYALENVMTLCHDLHRNGKLPAILFNYSRHHVEALALRIFEELVAAETEFKTTDAQWLKKVEAWKVWKLAEVARKAAMEKTARASARGEDDGPGEDAEGDAGWQASFDPTAPLPQFSFVGKSYMSAYEIEKDIDSLQWHGVAAELCDALRRGVGVHHAGMNLRYRQTVERYFRAGQLRVVVATGTLALGINMPASTSVFTEDSIFLTALEYRQAAGRAGRRGFDLLGSVVFFGMPLGKVYRLLASRLPDLSGHFPLSTTLVLRLHQLLSEEKSRPVGEEMMKSLLSLNKISLGNPAAKLEVLHHLRFSIDYLRRFGLLSEAGQPVNLSGLTQHLYWAEPMNLNFAFLLNSGVLAEVIKNGDAELNLLTCLAHLFGRRRLPANLNQFRAEIIKRSPSKVFMEPLPTRVVEVLKQHNALVFQVMESYIHHYVATLEKEDVVELPLSRQSFQKSLPADSAQSPMLRRLAKRALPYKARSPFVALSGLDDAFTSIEDLSRTLRAGVTLQTTVVPLVSDLVDERIVLDAHIVDFYKHGQFQPLIIANGIRPGDVWQMLNDFRLIVSALRVSLEVLLKAHKKAELVRLKREEEEEEVVDDAEDAEDDKDGDDEEEVKGEDLEATPKWSPPVVIEPEYRDKRLWDVYNVLCRIQRVFGEKLEAMNA
ncbi:hypothetical protein HKX48_004690 [Thoreauomyces humboldtii]|nr:hypothetical protein HKX48_004690 [Thoreauomyces humboldtii]